MDISIILQRSPPAPVSGINIQQYTACDMVNIHEVAGQTHTHATKTLPPCLPAKGLRKPAFLRLVRSSQDGTELGKYKEPVGKSKQWNAAGTVGRTGRRKDCQGRSRLVLYGELT